VCPEEKVSLAILLLAISATMIRLTDDPIRC
jgi:hypothetical protein